MNQKLYKCNQCGAKKSHLFINCEVAFQCDDFSKFAPNQVKLLNSNKQKFEFVCEDCNENSIMNQPQVQNEINQLKIHCIEETSRTHAKLLPFKKYLHYLEELKIKQTQFKKLFEIDIIQQLGQLQKAVDKSLNKNLIDFFMCLKNQMQDVIQENKISEQNIIKTKQQYFETNQKLIDSKQLSINDTLKYFQGQVDNLEIAEKENLYQEIHRLLPEQPNPQNN